MTLATIFRDLSYRYQSPLDATIAGQTALSVGGEARSGQLAWDFRFSIAPSDESVLGSIGCGAFVNSHQPNFVGAGFTNNNCLKPTIS